MNNELTILANIPSSTSAKAFWVVVPKAMANSVSDACSMWRDYETGQLNAEAKDLPPKPDLELLMDGLNSVGLPVCETKRCVIVWIIHEYGTSAKFFYERNWIDTLHITIDVAAVIAGRKRSLYGPPY